MKKGGYCCKTPNVKINHQVGDIVYSKVVRLSVDDY